MPPSFHGILLPSSSFICRVPPWTYAHFPPFAPLHLCPFLCCSLFDMGGVMEVLCGFGMLTFSFVRFSLWSLFSSPTFHFLHFSFFSLFHFCFFRFCISHTPLFTMSTFTRVSFFLFLSFWIVLVVSQCQWTMIHQKLGTASNLLPTRARDSTHSKHAYARCVPSCMPDMVPSAAVLLLLLLHPPCDVCPCGNVC